MLTSYSASLISHIMTREYNLPFHSFEEFLEVGTYQLVVEPYSSQIMYFKMSNNSVLREVYQKFIAPIESSLPRTLLDRLEMVCANRKYSAIATERDVLVNLDKLNCTLNKVPNAYLAAAVSFSIQNKSPYREIFKQT
ncbi:uncharacterized protein LOC110832178 [Zootermopsis nevadensis]|nr:uncharacterized protein LOC110832178 [Zootermopsis nevadensis]